MAAIVISDSDSEFERDVQEVTRQSLAPSPVREVVSGSEDDEEKVRLVSSPFLAFRRQPRNETKLVISWKQHRGLDSGRRYASFASRQLPVVCSTSGTVLQATGSWARALEQGY